MLALAPSPLASTAPAALLVRVGLPAATSAGQMAYNPATTPPALVPILQAQAAPKVRETSDRDLDALLIAEIQHAARRLGHKNSATDTLDVNLMARDVAALLRLKWSYLTQGEVRQVFLLGSMRQLLRLTKDGQPDTSEVVTISSATVGEWLTRYKYQVKPQAMEHALRVEPQSSKLPHHHPICACWRIRQLIWLMERGSALATDSPDEADPANLLYCWLRDIGALASLFRSKPAAYWQQLQQREAYRLGQQRRQDANREHRRAANTFLRLVRQGLPSSGPLPARVRAACQWRTFCQWLIAHHARQTDLHALLWPLAQAAYTPPTHD